MVKVHSLHFSYTSCELGKFYSKTHVRLKKNPTTINCWFRSCGKGFDTRRNMGNQPFEGGCWLLKWDWGHSNSFLGSLEKRVEDLTWLVRDLNKHCLIGHFIAWTKAWRTFNSTANSCDCPSRFPLRGDQDLQVVLLFVPLQRQH